MKSNIDELETSRKVLWLAQAFTAGLLIISVIIESRLESYLKSKSTLKLYLVQTVFRLGPMSPSVSPGSSHPNVRLL